MGGQDGEPRAEPTGLRRFAPRSFRSRIVVSTVLLMTAAMVLVGLGIQLLLAYTTQRDITQVTDSRADAVLTTIQQASTRRVTVRAQSLDPGVEVYDADGNLVAGSVERRAQDVADDLSRVTERRFASGPEGDQRLLGVPFTTPSGERGVVVVSQETAAYERSEFYALLATIALGALVVVATALIALRVTRQALAPVSQMAERAAEWSEQDLTHRFDLGPPTNELAALGETLDHLLGRVASAILSEQRLTSELAHELRTPLTSVLGSADLALLRGVADVETRRDLEQIAASAREMSVVITTLLDLARSSVVDAGEHTCLVGDVVSRLVAGLPQGCPVRVSTDVSATRARVAAPGELVARAVAPVLDNAVRHAHAQVTVVARDHGDRVQLVVSDDGPGIPPEVRGSLFEPGVSGGPGGGSGLGLGIARRVARSFGGDIQSDTGPEPGPGSGRGSGPDGSPTSGARFVLDLPRR